MAKSTGQKLRLLYLMQLFREQTDETHPLTRQQLVNLLESRYDIISERKTFYDDLACLRQFGMEIEKTGKGGYFLAARTFEMPELRLLADAVGCSRFITEKKSRKLIEKLATLCSLHEGNSLRTQTDLTTRRKMINESIYYSIDAIYQAKNEAQNISFYYFNWSIGADGRPQKEYRHNKARYTVLPLSVVWNDENYYLIAFDEKSRQIRHYRIDKMEQLDLEERPKNIPFAPEEFNANEYVSKLFNMYGGKEEQVTLRFDKALLGVMIDQFGTNVMLRPDGENSLKLITNVVTSPQFLGWLFSLQEQVEILSPEDLRNRFYQQNKALENLYQPEIDT